jgi:GMP reductase
MLIETDLKLDFNHVLIRPKRSSVSSRSLVNINRTFRFKHSPKTWTGVPIIAANMDTIGTFNVYDTLKQHNIITALNKFYTIDDYRQRLLDPNLFMVSTGISDDDFDKLNEILSEIDCNWICIDIANGYLTNLVSFCSKVRETYPDKIIVAGNVVSRELVEELLVNGKVDIVKVGIGPGSACTTRLKTGVGMPQLSAIIECADTAHGLNGHIIGDGGITCPGDMSKAFGAGADFVMAGGIFSGHDQNPGEVEEINGKQVKRFYGMSSRKAMETHYGKMNNYRSSEGRELTVPYKGDLNNTVLDYLGGIRSTCTYINASSIEQLPQRTTFMMVGQQMNTSLCK